MTDAQARIVSALRASNTALTQAEIAHQVDGEAAEVAKDCYALGAAGVINYCGGFYSIVHGKGKR